MAWSFFENSFDIFFAMFKKHLNNNKNSENSPFNQFLLKQLRLYQEV